MTYPDTVPWLITKHAASPCLQALDFSAGYVEMWPNNPFFEELEYLHISQYQGSIYARFCNREGTSYYVLEKEFDSIARCHGTKQVSGFFRFISRGQGDNKPDLYGLEYLGKGLGDLQPSIWATFDSSGLVALANTKEAAIFHHKKLSDEEPIVQSISCEKIHPGLIGQLRRADCETS